MEPEILLQEINFNGNLQAIVEADGESCFMYLGGPEDSDFDFRAVWVRNLVDAPETLDVESMKEGVTPVMPKAHCRFPTAQAAPDPEELRLVWLPEGNGVALYEGEEILAIIPPWSGIDGCDGYARDCLGESPLAWELSPENELHERFREADEYWQAWDTTPIWEQTQQSQIDAAEACFGEHSNYYAIDGEEWPPKAMLRFRTTQWQVLITVGVSLRPQPNVELQFDDPSQERRIELAVALPADLTDEAVNQIGAYLSGQSSMPWSYYTFFGWGHTIPCDSWPNKEFAFAALSDESPIELSPSYEPMFEDPVNLLWFIPITESEREWAMQNTGDELLEKLPTDRWSKC